MNMPHMLYLFCNIWLAKFTQDKGLSSIAWLKKYSTHGYGIIQLQLITRPTPLAGGVIFSTFAKIVPIFCLLMDCCLEQFCTLANKSLMKKAS